MNIELFRREIEAQIERLNKNHANYRFAKRYGLIRETKRPIKFYFEQIDTRKHLQEIIEDDEKDGLYGDSFKNEQNKD